MALILDTNALSAFADADPGVLEIVKGEEELAVPSVVLGEFLFGIRASRKRERYEQLLQGDPPYFRILDVRASTASHYAEIRSELKAIGQPIPSNDLWIAALCREHGRPLLTRDKHFASVSGLAVIGW